MNTYRTKYANCYDVSFLEKSLLIILFFLCLSYIIPSASQKAHGLDITEPEKSFLLDKLLYSADYNMIKKNSFSDDIVAKTGETELLAQAGDSNPKPSIPRGYYGTKDWRVFIGLYLWLSGLDGQTGTGNTVADVDMSFGDLWENFDVGGQAHIEFWWKRLIFYVDPTYIVLKADNSETTIIGSLRSNLKVKLFMLDMGAGYRVANIPLGKSIRSGVHNSLPSLAVDLYGGGRIFSLDTRLNLMLDTPIGPVARSVKDDNTWFDFLVGTRLFVKFTENFGLTTKTDIGGFGLGFSSDIAWNFDARFGYKLPWWGVTPYLGYRVLYIDYKDGSGDDRFVYKMWQTGPMVGLGVTF